MSTTKTFVITGTSSGLGRAIVSQIYNESEHRIVAVSRSISSEQEHFDRSRFSHIYCDFSESVNGDSIVFEIKKIVNNGDIIFISNAGTVAPIGNVGTFDSVEVKRVVDINVIYPLILTNSLLREFVNQKVTIINISSGASDKPIAGWSMYCSTKAAARMFFDVLQQENRNLDVVNFEPGVMDTQMQRIIRDSNFEAVGEFKALHSSGKLKDPAKVANEIIQIYL